MINGSSIRPLRKLPPVVGNYFHGWIRLSTWASGHGSDDERFFRFVKATLRFMRRKPITEQQLQDLILEHGAHACSGEHLVQEARERASLYQSIREYERSSFPDPLTEKTSVVGCYFALTRAFGDEDPRVHYGMCELFGDDWREQAPQIANLTNRTPS